MDRAEALATLGLEEGSSVDAVELAFTEKSRELRERIAGAPTEALKGKFEASLTKVKTAAGLLLDETAAPAAPTAAAPTTPPPASSSPLSATKLADLPLAHSSSAPGAAVGLSPGQVLAERYEIRQQLGAGGMGAVFAAFDRVKQEDVAIKVLLPSLTSSQAARERFLNEARISAKLSHPNVINVFDVQEEGGLHFLTMELLEGQSLRQAIEGRKLSGHPWPIEEVARIGEGVCDALSYAHEFTIHRDVKPDNIWLSEDGTVKLMDFGIARVAGASHRTQTGMAMGTAYYMAPEQLSNAAGADARADQYSLGVVLFELLTGEVPAGRARPIRELRKDVPKKLSQAIERAMEGSPDRRFASVADLKAALGGKRVKAAASSSGSEGGWGKLALVLLLVGAGVAAFLTQPHWRPTVEAAIRGASVDAAQLKAAKAVQQEVETRLKEWAALSSALKLSSEPPALADARKELEQGASQLTDNRPAEAKGSFEAAKGKLVKLLQATALKRRSEAESLQRAWELAEATHGGEEPRSIDQARKAMRSGSDHLATEAFKEAAYAFEDARAALDSELEKLVKRVRGQAETHTKTLRGLQGAYGLELGKSFNAVEPALAKADELRKKSAWVAALTAYGKVVSSLQQLIDGTSGQASTQALAAAQAWDEAARTHNLRAPPSVEAAKASLLTANRLKGEGETEKATAAFFRALAAYRKALQGAVDLRATALRTGIQQWGELCRACGQEASAEPARLLASGLQQKTKPLQALTTLASAQKALDKALRQAPRTAQTRLSAAHARLRAMSATFGWPTTPEVKRLPSRIQRAERLLLDGKLEQATRAFFEIQRAIERLALGFDQVPPKIALQGASSLRSQCPVVYLRGMVTEANLRSITCQGKPVPYKQGVWTHTFELMLRLPSVGTHRFVLRSEDQNGRRAERLLTYERLPLRPSPLRRLDLSGGSGSTGRQGPTGHTGTTGAAGRSGATGAGRHGRGGKGKTGKPGGVGGKGGTGLAGGRGQPARPLNVLVMRGPGENLLCFVRQEGREWAFTLAQGERLNIVARGGVGGRGGQGGRGGTGGQGGPGGDGGRGERGEPAQDGGDGGTGGKGGTGGLGGIGGNGGPGGPGGVGATVTLRVLGSEALAADARRRIRFDLRGGPGGVGGPGGPCGDGGPGGARGDGGRGGAGGRRAINPHSRYRRERKGERGERGSRGQRGRKGPNPTSQRQGAKGISGPEGKKGQVVLEVLSTGETEAVGRALRLEAPRAAAVSETYLASVGASASAPALLSGDSQGLSHVLFALVFKHRPSLSEFTTLGSPSPGDIAKLIAASKVSGFRTLVRPKYIKSCTCEDLDQEAGSARGTLVLEVPGVLRARVAFEASRIGDTWRFVRFELPEHSVGTVLGAKGRWRAFADGRFDDGSQTPAAAAHAFAKEWLRVRWSHLKENSQQQDDLDPAKPLFSDEGWSFVQRGRRRSAERNAAYALLKRSFRVQGIEQGDDGSKHATVRVTLRRNVGRDYKTKMIRVVEETVSHKLVLIREGGTWKVKELHLGCWSCLAAGTCKSCGGRGLGTCYSCKGLKLCKYCGGKGLRTCYSCEGSKTCYCKRGKRRSGKTCSRCRGSGDCKACKGVGGLPCGICKGAKNCSACKGVGGHPCVICKGTKNCTQCKGSAHTPQDWSKLGTGDPGPLESTTEDRTTPASAARAYLNYRLTRWRTRSIRWKKRRASLVALLAGGPKAQVAAGYANAPQRAVEVKGQAVVENIDLVGTIAHARVRTTYVYSGKTIVSLTRVTFSKHAGKWLIDSVGRSCYSCKGSAKCSTCKGAGFKEACGCKTGRCLSCKGTGQRSGGRSCSSCGKTGKCSSCKGTGKKRCYGCDLATRGKCRSCKGQGWKPVDADSIF